jgi:methylmalonyl-CoA mutase, N-terminal domain
MGGSVDAIEEGFIQDEIARSAYEYQRQIENGEKIIVGVNKFTVDQEAKIPPFKIDDSIRGVQSAKLATLRANRNNIAVASLLAKIDAAAKMAPT